MADGWLPATKQEVQQAIEAEREQTGSAYWADLACLLVDPYPASIERFGESEQAFVVAKRSARVVYFDDVEEIFGTATEAEGMLTDCAHLGALAVALKEIAEGR